VFAGSARNRSQLIGRSNLTRRSVSAGSSMELEKLGGRMTVRHDPSVDIVQR
jgi:hypothetical protein